MLVRKHGPRGASRKLHISRDAAPSIAAGLDVMPGTLALVRESVAKARRSDESPAQVVVPSASAPAITAQGSPDDDEAPQAIDEPEVPSAAPFHLALVDR